MIGMEDHGILHTLLAGEEHAALPLDGERTDCPLCNHIVNSIVTIITIVAQISPTVAHVVQRRLHHLTIAGLLLLQQPLRLTP